MSAFALHDGCDQREIVRWGTSAALIVAIHAALIALGTAWYRQSPPPGIALPTIMIDLAPIPAEPSAPQLKEPPSPDMQQPEAPPPPPEPLERQAVEAPVEPAPPVERPIPRAPPLPEQTIAPTSPMSEPATIVPEPARPTPAKRKLAHTETKKTTALPQPRSDGATRSEHQTSAPSSASSGVPNPAAIAAYNQRVAAHLQSFKQYPASARAAGEQGLSRVSFTLGRNGQVLGNHLIASSGHPALDSETLGMVRRAQPFPPMPPELKQASISFTVPIKFSIH